MRLSGAAHEDLFGGWQSRSRHTLADEYSLLVFPLVLGSGKQVFPDDFPTNLKLIETKAFPMGVMMLRYQPDAP